MNSEKASEPKVLKLESDLVRSVSQSFRSCASKASPVNSGKGAFSISKHHVYNCVQSIYFQTIKM